MAADARRGSDRQQTAAGYHVSTSSAETWCEASCTKSGVMWSESWVGKRTLGRSVESGLVLPDFGRAPLKLGRIT